MIDTLVSCHQPLYPETEYTPDLHDGEQPLELLRNGVAGLREAEAENVAQFGGCWSLTYARDIEAELSDAYGIKVILNWAAIVDALSCIGAKRISVAAGYYRPAWTAASITFL